MIDPIDLYFDFSSSYSYLAQARISEIESETSTQVNLRPIVLGAIFHELNHSVPQADSRKMKYLHSDVARTAAYLGLKYQDPPVFPFNAMEAMRFFYLIDARDNSLAKQFSSSVFSAAYTQGVDMGESENVAKLLAELGLDYEALSASDEFVQAKLRLKQETQTASAAKIFGAPSFVYQGELFWGEDRIDQLISRVNS